MSDIVLLNCVVVAVLAVWPLAQVRRGLPELLPGPSLNLPELDSRIDEYRRRYQARMVLFAVGVISLVYILVRILRNPPSALGAGLGAMRIFVGVGIAVYLCSLVAELVLRHRLEARLAAEHPQLDEAVMPIHSRLRSILGRAIILISLAIGIQFTDFDVTLSLSAVGMTVAAVLALNMKATVNAQSSIALDSRLGERISALTDRFGFTPRWIVVERSLYANAGLHLDGRVVVTMALRLLLTEDQLVAVLAREISGAQLGAESLNARRMGWASAAPFLTTAVGGASVFVLLSVRPFNFLCLPPLMACMLGLTDLPGLMIKASIMRTLETRVDEAVKDIGLGPDLAVALTTICRYLGVSRRWFGIDNLLLPQSCLDARIALLTSE